MTEENHTLKIENELDRAIMVKLYTKDGKQLPSVSFITAGSYVTFDQTEPLYCTIYDPRIERVIYPKREPPGPSYIKVTPSIADAYLLDQEGLCYSERKITVYNTCRDKAFILMLSSGEEYNIGECSAGKSYPVASGTEYKIVTDMGVIICEGKVIVRDINLHITREIFNMRVRMHQRTAVLEEEEEEEAVQVDA